VLGYILLVHFSAETLFVKFISFCPSWYKLKIFDTREIGLLQTLALSNTIPKHSSSVASKTRIVTSVVVDISSSTRAPFASALYVLVRPVRWSSWMTVRTFSKSASFSEMLYFHCVITVHFYTLALNFDYGNNFTPQNEKTPRTSTQVEDSSDIHINLYRE
jgi:hypothetical protein